MNPLYIGMLVIASYVAADVAPPPEDCNISGPAVNNVAGGPVIVDLGSSGNTNGAGCDGCTVTAHHFKVTWPIDGEFVVATIPGSTTITSDVDQGETTTVNLNMKTSLGCNSTLTWNAYMTGSSLGISTLKFQCLACL